MKFRVVIESDEDGVFVVHVPALRGCIAQGATREAALQNIKAAIALCLESLRAHGDPMPAATDEAVVDVP